MENKGAVLFTFNISALNIPGFEKPDSLVWLECDLRWNGQMDSRESPIPYPVLWRGFPLSD